jgi:hypothetical protein
MIYVTDGCTDPLLSVPAVVTAHVEAPTLSMPMFWFLSGLLVIAGCLRVLRQAARRWRH